MNNQTIASVGILGMGSFGSFVASLIPSRISVTAYDPDPKKTTPGTFEEACTADVVILAVPLSAYSEVLSNLKPFLRPETLVIDVCSVKERPQALFAEFLPHHANVLLTHPLFGPQSAARNSQGHHLIVTKQSGERAKQVIDFCKTTLGLTVSILSGKEHDRIMAQVHALTFFAARVLAKMRLEEMPFETPSYKMITDLAAFDKSHTDELFDTIELGNAYAKDVREELLRSMERLCQELAIKEMP